MGRTREEHHALMGPIERHPNPSKSPIVVEINDPVAHFRYVFILDEPVVHRQELPDSPRRASDHGQPGHAVMSETTGVVAVRSGETKLRRLLPFARAFRWLPSATAWTTQTTRRSSRKI